MQSFLTKLLLLVLLLAGAFFFGKHVGTSKEREASLRLQQSHQSQLAELQAKSSKATVKTVVEYKDRVIEKEKKIYVYKDKIVESVVDNCHISADTVRLLSEAVDQANDANPSRRTDEAAPRVEKDLKALLENYTDNLARFSANREQLRSLQNWIQIQLELHSSPQK